MPAVRLTASMVSDLAPERAGEKQPCPGNRHIPLTQGRDGTVGAGNVERRGRPGHPPALLKYAAPSHDGEVSVTVIHQAMPVNRPIRKTGSLRYKEALNTALGPRPEPPNREGGS